MWFRNYVTLSGRIGRKRFWFTLLGALGATAVALILDALVANLGRPWAIVASIIFIPPILLACWVSLATQVKRWHDLGRSGWMVLISFIPVVGLIANVICLGIISGSAGPNRFDAAGDGAAALPPRLPTPPSRRGRFVTRFLLGGVGLVMVLGATLYLVSPRGAWPVRREWLRAVCGSPEASQRLAWRFREGVDVSQDFPQALKWFERAAKKGMPQAQYDAGVLYFYGLGVPADSSKASYWLEQSAQQSYGPASTLLGLIANEQAPGGGQALAYWLRAASQGDAWAESLLSSAYLAQRNENGENLILALYWMESARRDGVEPVGGQLQHLWATVAENRLEFVTAEVFRRLAAGSPAPLSPEALAQESTDTGPKPATIIPPTDAAHPDADLAAEVLAQVQQAEEYTAVDALYEQKSKADSAWADSDDGQVVADYLKTMRNDARATHIAKTLGYGEILEYAVGGKQVFDKGVRVDGLTADPEYRRFIVGALAKNIAGATRPLRIIELLKESEETQGDTAK